MATSGTFCSELGWFGVPNLVSRVCSPKSAFGGCLKSNLDSGVVCSPNLGPGVVFNPNLDSDRDYLKSKCHFLDFGVFDSILKIWIFEILTSGID